MRWAEEDDDAEDTREYSAVGAGKHVSESDFEVMSSRVKSHFISLGGRFATLSDKELSEISAFLFDHHDRRVGVENLLGEPISLQHEP
ncbi:hypothetical protein AB4Z52_22790 [Rhizobium sp. 2YAF20]|uniref:hypothetical protein n=1 Tax=Rhizobium sp. 2YAF20 TaxID=3233027 RepID=UPI003F9C3E68